MDAFFITPEYVREMAYNSRPTDNYFESLKMIHCAGSPLKAEMVEVFQNRLLLGIAKNCIVVIKPNFA